MDNVGCTLVLEMKSDEPLLGPGSIPGWVILDLGCAESLAPSLWLIRQDEQIWLEWSCLPHAWGKSQRY